jgi:hypothetical protein
VTVGVVVRLEVVDVQHHQAERQGILPGAEHLVPDTLLVMFLHIKTRQTVRDGHLEGLLVEIRLFQGHGAEVGEVGEQTGVLLAENILLRALDPKDAHQLASGQEGRRDEAPRPRLGGVVLESEVFGGVVREEGPVIGGHPGVVRFGGVQPGPVQARLHVGIGAIANRVQGLGMVPVEKEQGIHAPGAMKVFEMVSIKRATASWVLKCMARLLAKPFNA